MSKTAEILSVNCAEQQTYMYGRCVFRAEAGPEVLPLLLTTYRQHARNCLLTYTSHNRRRAAGSEQLNNEN